MSSYSSRFKVQRYVFFSDEGNFTCKKFYFFLSFLKGLASARIEAGHLSYSTTSIWEIFPSVISKRSIVRLFWAPYLPIAPGFRCSSSYFLS